MMNDEYENRSTAQNTDVDAFESGSTRDRALQKAANKEQRGPISSGQQSSSGVGETNAGGYSTPESGFGQPEAKGGYTEQQGGYNQGSYNQPGTYSQSQGDLQPRMDGYSDTQGSGYDQGSGDASMAQQGYDPGGSGVKPSQKTPGMSVDTPGRETGTSWGEDEQMGQTTDTQERQNPAG